MAEKPFLFDDESAGRIARAVRQVEGALQPQRPQRGGGDAGAGAGVYFARVTDVADSNGYYPATITRLNTNDQSYTDFAGCYVTTPNGETLEVDSRYAVKPVGSYASGSGAAMPAYQTLSSGSVFAFVRPTGLAGSDCGELDVMVQKFVPFSGSGSGFGGGDCLTNADDYDADGLDLNAPPNGSGSGS